MSAKCGVQCGCEHKERRCVRAAATAGEDADAAALFFSTQQVDIRCGISHSRHRAAPFQQDLLPPWLRFLFLFLLRFCAASNVEEESVFLLCVELSHQG
uniref:Uncharacterized protein n=1 Tax=Physcomitrium patens TaxID=3218 RepID=A0A2K1IXK2_PHYPA|nr:hypothetical protein PHYPA_023826 [Physcomitrium patens]